MQPVITLFILGCVLRESYAACDDAVMARKDIGSGTVFNIAKCGKRYDINSKNDAIPICARNGAGVLASKEQLKAAFDKDMNVCHCGWLSDGTAAFPNNNDKRGGCSTPNKIHDCPDKKKGVWGKPKGGNGWNALCFVCKDEIKAEKKIKGGKVLNIAKCGKRYDMDTKEDGAKICERNGAVLATRKQLQKAFDEDMNVCHCGWLSDGTAAFPNNNDKRGGCNTPNKIHNCPDKKKGVWGKPGGGNGWNALCFACDDTIKAEKQIEGGKVFNVARCGRRYNINTRAEAEGICKKHGAVLATPEQLKAAFDKDMNVCHCGWLSDGTAAFPNVNDKSGGCKTPNAIHDCPDNKKGVWGKPKGGNGWNALCFKENKDNK